MRRLEAIHFEVARSPRVRKEALISSQIEGTQCTLDDIFDPLVEGSANADVADVVNYVRAMNCAISDLAELPICCRSLRRAHKVLMQGVRGEEKTPGEFRTVQNWIGVAGCTLEEARFVPPNVEDMHAALTDLERYIHGASEYDALIRAGLIHYQFETIHPLLDGNGRVGRLLILLFLIEAGVLDRPMLYISYFLKRNQVEYYDRMSEVRRTGNYEQWVKFFLRAVDAASLDAFSAVQHMRILREGNLALLPEGKAGESARRLLEYLERQPIIELGKTARDLGVSYNTVASAAKRLEERGILVETTGRRRSRVYAYESYLQILRRGTE